MSSDNFRIIFFGTPDFAAKSLESLIQNGYHVVAAVTAPDKPAGRGMKLTESAVKKTAIQYGIPVLQPEKLKSAEFENQLAQLSPDLGVVIAFRMLPEKVWNFPKKGTINLHASLLPQYRGAAPIQHAIINGETKSGLSVFFLKHEIDTGDIIAMKEMEIGENENAGSLHDRMMDAGAMLISHAVQDIIDNKIKPISQTENENLKSAPKLNREFCKLDINESCQKIHNKIRGLSPYPGAWISTKWGDIKVLSSAMDSNIIIPTQDATHESLEEGLMIDSVICVKNKKLYLKCADGFLEILQLQLPGKAKVGSKDFINGLKTI